MTIGAGYHITNNAACILCSTGFYCPGGGMQCTCSFGASCTMSGVLSVPGYDCTSTLCSIGTYNTGKQLSCTTVQPGRYLYTRAEWYTILVVSVRHNVQLDLYVWYWCSISM